MRVTIPSRLNFARIRHLKRWVRAKYKVPEAYHIWIDISNGVPRQVHARPRDVDFTIQAEWSDKAMQPEPEREIQEVEVPYHLLMSTNESIRRWIREMYLLSWDYPVEIEHGGVRGDSSHKCKARWTTPTSNKLWLLGELCNLTHKLNMMGDEHLAHDVGTLKNRHRTRPKI